MILEHPILVHFIFILFKYFFSFLVISLYELISHLKGQTLFFPYLKIHVRQNGLSHLGQKTGSQARHAHIEHVKFSWQPLSEVRIYSAKTPFSFSPLLPELLFRHIREPRAPQK